MENEPIRIAQIMGKWLGGGVEAVIMNYYRNIDKSKIQFDFICDSDSTDIPYEEIEALGGRVILCPPYQKLFKYVKELKRVFKKNNYKIVHSNINTLSVFPLYAAKKAGVPVRIAHSHSTIINNKKEWKRNFIKNILKHFSKIYATDCLACSDMAAVTQFGEKSFNDGKVKIIYNAIELKKFEYNKSIRKSKRKEFNIKDDAIVIGHVGRFADTKNHDFLIDVFNKYHKINSNSILVLAGQGKILNEIKNKAKKLALDKYVYFIGQRNDINEIYQLFDIFMLPSLYEGLGMALIEAQISGLPCITSTVVPKITKVIENFSFLDLNESIDSWVNKIIEYTNCKRSNCIDIFENTRFNIYKESKKLEELYINRVGEIDD